MVKTKLLLTYLTENPTSLWRNNIIYVKHSNTHMEEGTHTQEDLKSVPPVQNLPVLNDTTRCMKHRLSATQILNFPTFFPIAPKNSKKLFIQGDKKRLLYLAPNIKSQKSSNFHSYNVDTNGCFSGIYTWKEDDQWKQSI